MNVNRKTPEQLLSGHGIRLSSYSPGRYYTKRPECSRDRSTAAHRSAQCLGVTLEGDTVRFGCNHCGMTGPKSNGAGVPPFTGLCLPRPRRRSPIRKVRNTPGRQPQFWLEKWDGAGWEKGTKDVDTSILYRANEVREAIENGRQIACVEGEKDADRVWSIGIPATCNAHGASETGKAPKWTRKHSEQLKGADIVVLNDNDVPGVAHAEAACKLSLGLAKKSVASIWPWTGRRSARATT